MARDLREYRVFFASPGDLAEERLAFRRVIDEYNQLESGQRGVHFTAVCWEDALPRMGRPQAIINEEIQTSDYFVLMLWNRWGSPPDKTEDPLYTSGTEEEYHLAKACCNDPAHSLRDVAVFFKSVKPPQMIDPDPQLERVLQFRRELESSHELLFHLFDKTGEFERILRGLLGRWRRDHEDGKPAKVPRGPAAPLLPPPSDEISVPHAASPNADTLAEAWRCADAGKLTDAETLFARSIVKGDDPEAFRSYGAFLLRVGRREQAAVMFNRILELTSGSDGVWRAIAYGNLGLVLDLSGDFAAAEEMHRNSLAIHEQLGRLDGMAQVRNNLGILAKRQGRFEEAERLYGLALNNARTAGRGDIEGRAYNNLGLLYCDRRDFEKSDLMLQNAMALAEDRGKGQEIATAAANLGVLNFDRGRLDVAKTMFSRALSISRQLGFREGIALSSQGMGALCLSQGNSEEAYLLLQDALRINVEMDRTDGVASASLNLGIIAATRGDLESAEGLLETALDMFAQLGEPMRQAVAEENLGEVVRSRGELERARQLWNHARRRFEEQGLGARVQQITARLNASP